MRNVEKWTPHREQNGPSEVWGVAVQNTDPVELIIKPTTKLDASDCQLICATHNAALLTAGQEKALWCELFMVSHRTGQPIIQISFGSELIQMEIREARQHVGILNECIEAAISDALILKFMREVVYAGEDPAVVQPQIGKLLQMFRDFREALTKPTTEATDQET